MNMKDISFKKLKKSTNVAGKNYGRSNRLLVKGANAWEEQDERPDKDFKLYIPLDKPASELLAVRNNSLQIYKTAIQYMSCRIIANPTLTKYQYTMLGFLLEDCKLVAMSVRKLAAIAIMEIFHEILPEFKIVEQNTGGDLKEEVRDTYKREETILKFYMKYLKRIMVNLDEVKKNKKDIGYQRLETTLVTCLGSLFVKHPNFNYRNDLLVTISPYISSAQKATREQVFKIFVELLKGDETGDMSLMIVSNIYKVVMKMKLKIHPDVVKVLYYLRLEHLYNIDKIRFEKRQKKKDMDHKELLLRKLERKKGRAHYSRKERNEHKKDLHKRENKWLEEKDAKIEKQEQNNTEVLQKTLGIYFLILKKKPKPLVISAVFEGLARYAHLINIEFFCDLLKVMDEFFTSYRLSTSDQLYCIQTVFTILQTQNESLAIDPYKFYVHLYKVITKIPTECSLENVHTLVNIFNLLFLGKRSTVMSVPRVLALVKRFSGISCTLPNHMVSLIIMATTAKHCTLNSYNEILLDTDQHGWPGMFRMNNKEPDTANAGATALWELYFLRRSYHPHVSQLAAAMIKGDIYKGENSLVKRLINRSSKDLSQDYNVKRGVLNPAVPSPDDATKNAKKKKNSHELELYDVDLYEMCTKDTTEQSQKPKRKKRKIDQSAEAVGDQESVWELSDVDFGLSVTNEESVDVFDISYLLLGGSELA